MQWIRKNWRWLLAVVICGVAVPVFILLWMSGKNREAQQLKAQLAMMKAKAKISGVEADMAARAPEIALNRAEAKKAEAAIVEAKKEAVAVAKTVEGMTDEEVHAEFDRLGL